ncbi:zinc-binding metallopeptidase family protein [Thiofilum flexile]|uniref:zinc-binding metallopeptidase family protein n=1 Tax=Thiofilum flexile TaxID=125627 RepID=UPI00039D834B|nr:putative zinc-binding peptidase [Thiofilum flexile]
MEIFQCQHCQQIIFFENTYCEKCYSALGFLPTTMSLITLTPHFEGGLSAYNNAFQRFKYCNNFTHGVCNWLLPADSEDTLCLACDLNDRVPNLDSEQHRVAWSEIEVAKHWLVYDLLQLGLPVVSKNIDEESGLSFDFLSDDMMQDGEHVMTGHMQGLITLNISEADPVQRERMREQMDEPYRTLIGHFRHEVGHYYWDLLISPDSARLEAFRALFGDEREDYQEALEKHYEEGPPGNWQVQFVSTYASTHPWEDWAETWAHYMHMVSTLHTAKVYGLGIHPQIGSTPQQESPLALELRMGDNLLLQQDIDPILSAWLKLTMSVNSLNRSMGQPDLYPFVISARVREKLGFVHQLILDQRSGLNIS